MSVKNPKLAKRAREGELPVLNWRGGVEKEVKSKKYGSLHYVAQWQGLRREDLCIAFDEERELTCSKTGVTVVFSADSAKYTEA